jgi:peptidyl-prolyl cis-trans isomerase SurA
MVRATELRVTKIRWVAALALAVGALGVSSRADAVIVERIVAVVGDRPVLLSELRNRAKPNLLRLLATQRDANYHAAAETEIYKEFLNRIIDERLEEGAAEKARIAVLPEEVDRGIQNVATNAKIPLSELLSEVRRQGLSEQDFRDEIRRQILEGKLVELRVRPRVRVTDQDARAAYQHWMKEVSEQRPVDLRVLALRVTTDPQARLALAEELVKRARAGEDFCKLVVQYTDDADTKGSCGSRGPQAMAALVPQIQERVRTMKTMEVSEPVLIQGSAIVIIQLLSEPRIPPFEEVRAEMSQRAVLEGLDHQRKLWLQELRRGVYIDVRL